MKKKYVIALDQGTTSSRALIFDRNAQIAGIGSMGVNQVYPAPGWVEHDACDIWEGQLSALKNSLKTAAISPDEISCIGIANQRETVAVWDRKSGIPVSNAIVWQCRRTAPLCDMLIRRGLKDVVREKTGLVIDAYFSGTKIKWLLDNVKGAREKAEAGELLAGTMDTWLIWNLTGGRLHVTDCSNASRTMLFDINKLEWDRELLDELNIPESMLPKVVRSSGVIGETDEKLLGVKIPISGVAGDQQAALFGQACFDTGSAKNTFGTGCFILMNTGKTKVRSENGMLATIAWDTGEGVEYALEGSVFNAGATVQWLRDGLKLIESASQAEEAAAEVCDTGGVYMVPAFTGLGAPYWDMYARGMIIGITRGTKREHVIRAALESIAYQSRDVLKAMENDSGIALKELKVDGGASANSFLMQFQADILGVNVNRPWITETTALGTACLAGIGTGFWESKRDIIKMWKSDRIFTPLMSPDVRELKYSGWKRAVERSLAWETK